MNGPSPQPSPLGRGGITGKQIVFLSSVDWGAAWQRHQAWASRFAAAGNEVFFVENTGFRDLRGSDAARIAGRLLGGRRTAPKNSGVRVISPLVLPPTKEAFRRANNRWLIPRLMRRLRAAGLRDAPLVFAYLPTATTLELLEALRPSMVVYDCVDNFEGHSSPPSDLRETERALLKRADRVLTTSPFLFHKMSAGHPRVLELHHGVDERFLEAAGATPAQYRSFCYFGSLWSAIDYRYIVALAEAGYSVSLLGPERERIPNLPKSVRRLPVVSAEALPKALAGYDGLLLPYADTPYNQGVTPAKTYECLATGKPVLAAPIGGLGAFPDYFYLEADPSKWPAIAAALPRTESAVKRQARVALAREHSTGAQFAKLLAFLGSQGKDI